MFVFFIVLFPFKAMSVAIWLGNTKESNEWNKIKTIINTPLTELNLSKYISGYNPESYVYNLFGTGNHFGNTTGGHYTSNIKNPNGKWYSFNDNNITEITEDKIINANTYSLFYRKK